MTRGALLAAVGLGLAGLFVEPVPAAVPDQPTARLDPRKVIEQSERAIGREIGNYRLTDSTGAPVPLRNYRGKPLVISLIYTACSSVCPPTTQHLIDAVKEAGRVFGYDGFNVLTVGFDARNDSPGRMAQFASIQGIKFNNWRLASADAATIEALLHDLGFSYVSVAGGFDHVTQTTIVDRAGKVFRHVYGEDFPLPMFIEPMKDVVYGTASSFSMAGIFDRVKFICTVYDPGAGRYRIDYGLAFGSVIAAFSLLIFGGLLYREWFRTGRV
ncbi:MAG: SCO family protein [Rhizobiales bacterium]|nr:SCO family protein [Hyphomicrobiales bacterium]